MKPLGYLMSLSVSVALASGPAVAIVPSQSAVIDTFRQACMTGQAKLSAGDARLVTGKEIPPYIRDYFAYLYKDRSVYKLSALPMAYLVVFSTNKPSLDQFKNGCALVTEYITAYDLWSSITGKVSEDHKYKMAEKYVFSKPSEGWELSVRWFDTFELDSHRYTIAQIGIMTDAQKKIFKRDGYGFVPYRGPHIPSNG